MRTIAVLGVLVLCISSLGLVGATREQRVIEAAAARTPALVEVSNFPATQNVAGTVNVGNLPAVQGVSGNVAVTNLPLDANGNLRVASASLEGPPQFQLVKLVEGLQVTSGAGPYLSNPYPVAGWKNVFAFARSVTPPGSYNNLCITPRVQVGADDLFVEVGSFNNSLSCMSPGSTATGMVQVVLAGPEIRFPIEAYGQTGITGTVDVWLYLTR